MNVILIGFMGSGKTTIGKMLSGAARYRFTDTDELIELREKRKINDIFATDGEEYFRDLETAVIKEIANTMDRTVISVGGGLPVRDENRTYMKKNAVTIYLRATVDSLCKRLGGDTTRPLLKGDDLRQRIESLMEKRSRIYEEAADFVLDTDSLLPSEVVEKLLEFLKQCDAV